MQNPYLEIVDANDIDIETLSRTKSEAAQLKLTACMLLDNADMLDTLTLHLTYHTNTIEGSTMTLSDVEEVIFDHKVLTNRTAIEQAEARNHPNYVGASATVGCHATAGCQRTQAGVLQVSSATWHTRPAGTICSRVHDSAPKWPSWLDDERFVCWFLGGPTAILQVGGRHRQLLLAGHVTPIV